MKLTEKAYINRAAIACHAGIDMVLLAAYVAEWSKGSKTTGFILILLAFMIIPVGAELLCYWRNRESKWIHHIMGVCYSSMYMYIIFTSDSMLPFVYAIPMYIIITLYSDIPYCVSICVGGLLCNIADVAWHARTVGYSAAELTDVKIRLACMAIVGLYMVITSIVMKKINGEKLRRLAGQQENTQKLLDQVLQTSDAMSAGIGEVADRMETLGNSVNQIHASMQEVSAGSNETAQSVQLQMQRTEEIQTHITRVKESADQIGLSMAEAYSEVKNGRENMDQLTAQVDQSMEANRRVLERMQELNSYTQQMNTIIETINSIAGQTGMLALNASIEAARAGEAGRGFAVVAEQISSLAAQTKSATVNITGLIGNIDRELLGVTEAVDVVTQSSSSNAESVRAVADSFVRITQGTQNVNSRTEEMKADVEELEASNASIVESIQTISAVTEEVSAHSGETYEACEKNSRLVEDVARYVEELSRDAQRLKDQKM